MLRTTLFALALVLLGWRSGAWITRDFEVWTAEGARRLAVAERPVAVPPAILAGPGVADIDLRTWLDGAGRTTIVDFIYTRCPTVCSTLGSRFQQLQQDLAKAPGNGVKLLSISFDPRHDDDLQLRRYASQWRADPTYWTVATVPDAGELQRLLKAFEVVVIDDGMNGFEHNAALLVIDGRGRLVRIFDEADTDLALTYARAVAEGPARE